MANVLPTFPVYTAEQIRDALLEVLPNGYFWQWKDNKESNLYKVVQSYALGLVNYFNDIQNRAWVELNPSTTIDYISVWESIVGIPDGCLSITGTLQDRRKQVLSRLAGFNITTVADVKNYLTSAGYTFIDVINARDYVNGQGFDYVFDIWNPSPNEARYSLVLILEAGNPDNNTIECIVRKIKPMGIRIYRFEY
jgi:uncharacterized protein YmfQ (DUF2313 family)